MDGCGDGGSIEPTRAPMGDHYTILAGALEGRAGGGSGARVGRGSDAHLHQDEGETLGRTSSTVEDTRESRSNVFREVACIGWQPRSPQYWEVPPSLESLPSDVGLFLAGGLYVSVLKTRYCLFPLYHPSYVVVFLFMLVLFLFMSWGTPLLFEEATDDSDPPRFKYGTFFGCLIGMYLFSCVPAYIITRPAVVRFHEDMEIAVDDLVPIYRRFGRDLEYHRQGPAGVVSSTSASRSANCGSCCDRESFVKIKPFCGELTPEEVGRADAQWDPRNLGSVSVSEAIKVTVYHEGSIFGRACCGDDLSFDSVRSYENVKHQIDPFTWGAVAMQMRRFADATRPVRLGIAAVALALNQFRMSMTDASTAWYVTLTPHLLVVSLVVTLYYPCGLVTWCLVHVFGQKSMFDEMRSATERLSPLVEERSGYRLRFETEKDGCLGGTSACVYFKPRWGIGGDGPSTTAQFPSTLDQEHPSKALIRDIV